MSTVERDPETTTPFSAKVPFEPMPGEPGPGPDELDAMGEIDEPVSQAQFVALMGLVSALKARREANGLSLSDVSDRSGLTRAAISRLEGGWNNNPTLETLFRYGLALDVAVTLGYEKIEDEGE
jgi:DNA-binding XRE family transcriptional regulator